MSENHNTAVVDLLKQINNLESENKKLQARVEELETALTPFGLLGNEIKSDNSITEIMSTDSSITITIGGIKINSDFCLLGDDLIRAAEALNREKG